MRAAPRPSHARTRACTSGPNWQSAYPTLIFLLYMFHGDTGAALRHHDSLCRFFDHMEGLYNSTGAARFAEGNMYGAALPCGRRIPQSPH